LAPWLGTIEGLPKGFPVKLLLMGLLISELLGLGLEGIEDGDGLLEDMEMEAWSTLKKEKAK